MAYSKLVLFYLSQGTDAQGRMVSEILSWDDEDLELVHDYIQWLFPLQDKSAYNASAPVLTEEDIEIFRSNNALREKLLSSLVRLLSFYGFGYQEVGSKPTVVRLSTFEQQAQNWLTRHNHNFLRITRILKCLSLLGFKPQATAFEVALEEVYGESSSIIGSQTLKFWRDAIS